MHNIRVMLCYLYVIRFPNKFLCCLVTNNLLFSFHEKCRPFIRKGLLQKDWSYCLWWGTADYQFLFDDFANGIIEDKDDVLFPLTIAP